MEKEMFVKFESEELNKLLTSVGISYYENVDGSFVIVFRGQFTKLVIPAIPENVYNHICEYNYY